jgi:hypothetical protein
MRADPAASRSRISKIEVSYTKQRVCIEQGRSSLTNGLDVFWDETETEINGL